MLSRNYQLIIHANTNTQISQIMPNPQRLQLKNVFIQIRMILNRTFNGRASHQKHGTQVRCSIRFEYNSILWHRFAGPLPTVPPWSQNQICHKAERHFVNDSFLPSKLSKISATKERYNKRVLINVLRFNFLSQFIQIHSVNSKMQQYCVLSVYGTILHGALTQCQQVAGNFSQP